MFNKISLSLIQSQINETDWAKSIIKLKTKYAFKFNVQSILTSNIFQNCQEFIKVAMKFLILKSFSWLIVINCPSFAQMNNTDSCFTASSIAALDEKAKHFSHTSNNILNYKCNKSIDSINLSFQEQCLQKNKYKLYSNWQQEVIFTSASIKDSYCKIINKIKRNKKNQIMDIIIMLIALLSRDMFSKIFKLTRKINKSKVNEFEETKQLLKKASNFLQTSKQIGKFNHKHFDIAHSCYQRQGEKQEEKQVKEKDQNEWEQQGMLLVQQYAFIIITFQTTGNLINPQAFQYLKKKLTKDYSLNLKKQHHTSWEDQREKGKSREYDDIVQSLKCIRGSYAKNEKIRPFEQNDNSKQKQRERNKKLLKDIDLYDKRLNSKHDAVSTTLNQLLEQTKNTKAHLKSKSQSKSQDQKLRSYTKLQKINQVNLSKASKYYYKIQQKDLSLLQRTKQKSQSVNLTKIKQKYWRQVKSISKPMFQIKNKSIGEVQHNGKKEQRVNWQEVLQQMKKKFCKAGIQLQKFKRSQSFTGETGRSQHQYQISQNALKDIQNFEREREKKENKKDLKKDALNQKITQLNQAETQTQKWKQNQTKINSQHLPQIKNNSQFDVVDDYPQYRDYKITTIEENSIQQTQGSNTGLKKLKKKPMDVRRRRKQFQNKCKYRKLQTEHVKNNRNEASLPQDHKEKKQQIEEKQCKTNSGCLILNNNGQPQDFFERKWPELSFNYFQH